jgi:hypothetical protein
MEGVASEAASLAGHLKLSNLCWIYDNNHITIEGNTALTYSDDVATRFIGYGWNVTRVGDANDLEMLERAMTRHNYSGSALIEVLHTAQGLYGFLTMPLLNSIARKLNCRPVVSWEWQRSIILPARAQGRAHVCGPDRRSRDWCNRWAY